MPTDVSLIERLQADEPDAWNQLLDDYYDRIVIFCGRYVSDPGDAAALAHDSFLKAKERINTFSPDGSFSGWLYTVARNTSLDHVRREKKYDRAVKLSPSQSATFRIILHPETNAPGPRTACQQLNKKKALLACMDDIGELHAEVLMLRYIDDLSRTEIAALLDIPENTVKSRLLHGLRKLREVIPSELLS